MISYDIDDLIDCDAVVRKFCADYAETYSVKDPTTFVSTMMDVITRPSLRIYALATRDGSKLVLKLFPHEKLEDVFFAVHKRLEGGQ